MMINNKMKEIFEDKDFVRELMSLKDNAGVQAALKAKGLDLTEKEIQTIRDLQAKVKSGEITPAQLKKMESGEIPDELLDQVSGGFVGGFLLILHLIDKATDDDSTEVKAHGGGVSGSW